MLAPLARPLTPFGGSGADPQPSPPPDDTRSLAM